MDRKMFLLLRKCYYLNRGYEIYNFFLVFLLLVKFYWCVNFVLWYFFVDVDKDMYILYIVVVNCELSVFVRF